LDFNDKSPGDGTVFFIELKDKTAAANENAAAKKFTMAVAKSNMPLALTRFCQMSIQAPEIRVEFLVDRKYGHSCLI
jgi:hypothetical protein